MVICLFKTYIDLVFSQDTIVSAVVLKETRPLTPAIARLSFFFLWMILRDKINGLLNARRGTYVQKISCAKTFVEPMNWMLATKASASARKTLSCHSSLSHLLLFLRPEFYLFASVILSESNIITINESCD